LAYLGAAVLALSVIALLAFQRDSIDDAQGNWGDEPASAKSTASAAEHPLAFLRLPALWLCFAFFFSTTAALSAIQSFASPALASLYALALASTAYVVTGYMLFGALGMVVGGFWVVKSSRLDRNIAIAMTGSAVLLVLTASGFAASGIALMAVSLAGFGTGLAGPSRDMLIRRAAPPGATGRVYGTVYSGLDLGFAVSAPLFGALLDRHQPAAVFYGAALALMIGTAAASRVGGGRAGSAEPVIGERETARPRRRE
jgi:predicted MFS family arabinose efflux permease